MAVPIKKEIGRYTPVVEGILYEKREYAWISCLRKKWETSKRKNMHIAIMAYSFRNFNEVNGLKLSDF